MLAQLEWLTTPTATYLFLAAGLSVALALFLSLKREIALLEARLAEQRALLDSMANHTGAEIRQIDERLKDSEERCGSLVTPRPTVTGMSLSKRSQAIRMLRLGERPAQVAASLSLPVREVELLSKVQKLLASQALEA